MANQKIPAHLTQRAGESLQDWKYRVLLGKMRGEHESSWEEIAAVFKGDALEMEVTAYGANEYIQYQQDKRGEEELTINEVEIIDTLEWKRLDLEKEKVKVRDQKREYRSAIRDAARYDYFRDEVMSAVGDLAKIKPMLPKMIPMPGHSGREGVLLLSDWHVGMLANSQWGRYDNAVLKDRVLDVVRKTIQHGKEMGISKLHVFSLGDMVNGIIHVTTRIMSTEDVIQQTMLAAELLSEALEALASHFVEVDFYCVNGNHERITANPKESLGKENFSSLILWFIEERMKSFSNIYVHRQYGEEEMVCVYICGFQAVAVHGHRDKKLNAAKNLSLMLGYVPDYVFMGHVHHSYEQDQNNCEVITNGSLCGPDDYAVNNRFNARPLQKFLVFNEEEGKIGSFNLNCGEIRSNLHKTMERIECH